MFKTFYPCCVLLIAIAVHTLEAKTVLVEELTKWTLRNATSSLKIDVARVPSGVYTALKETYGDLLEKENNVALSWIANQTWIYSTTFDSVELGSDSLVNLTLHGVDTVSKLWLNGELIGETDNMFIRYSFAIGHLLLPSPSQNTLEIELLSPLQEARTRFQKLEESGTASAPPSCPMALGYVECHRNMLRKMQMSFGGEWNPVALSSGIWKPVTIEYYTVGILRDVDVAINRNDTHWTMDCRAFVSSPALQNFYAKLVVYASELLDEPLVMDQQEVNYASPVLEFKIHIPLDRVTLWWPNGYGKQRLYPVLFSLKCFSSEVPNLSSRTESQKLLKIGFRTIELVEDVDRIGRTFFFRVNGHPIFMKGANYVPANTLPELSAEADTVQHLLKSAHDVHMNMIRVWGGGLYESETFYNLADYYGLLVWQDMTFSKAAYPLTDDFVASVCLETMQNAQRLSYHPSLAMIVTNNEIELFLVKNRSEFGENATRLEKDYQALFMGTLKHELNIISRNDFNPRPGPLISTPSLGTEESGKELAKDPQSPNFGDIHFWGDEKDGFDPEIYPHGRFVSEFGYASLPMFSTWQRALGKDSDESNESIAALIRSHQHDPKGFIPILKLIALQLPFMLHNWDENIQEFIYFSQVSQAMTAKTAVDLFRTLRIENQTMGALMWQLNDVWVAPTWSCIDFYGNFKIVYYWAKDFLAPTRVIALYDKNTDNLNVTLTREDYMEHADTRLYHVKINTYLWTDFIAKKTIARAFALGSNELEARPIPLDTFLYENHSKEEIFLEIVLEDNNGVTMSRNYFYPVPIKNVKGIKDPELALEVVGPDCSTAKQPYANSFSLRITVKYPALLVYLEVSHPDYFKERHQFSTNGFTQTEPRKTVHLEFENSSECLRLTTEHIKVQTMNQYLI
ncbi:beta-mannosidase-like [Drosophila pseudoobscura]|uniref:beta-mannosidase n=1 Tax=Drosophila pseudoobscura pseudoobscura TaxID=46245 RepID=A0A6I8V4E9_DROPS|nr:beta-mannosidase [Drosophila pseudoobscura]